MSASQENVPSPPRESWVVQELFEAGMRLPAEVEQRIVMHRDAAVAPLIQVLEDRSLLEIDAPGEGCAPLHAARLLGELRATKAIAPLLRALQDSSCRELFAEEACEALVQMGPAALEPVLRAHAESAEPDHLLDFEAILCRLEVWDERVFERLVEALARDPAHAASCLVEYGDPRALVPLSRALDAYEPAEDEHFFFGQAAIQLGAAIQKLGGSLTPAQEQKYRDVLQRRRQSWLQPPRAAVRGPVKSAQADRRREARKRRKQQKASRKKNRR